MGSAYENNNGLEQHGHSPMVKWLRLACCFAMIWFFILVIAPLFQRIAMVNTLTSYIEETGINASALYYTEVEEAAMAELGSKSSLKYPPKGP